MKLLRKPQHALFLGLFCLLFGMSASAQGISVQLDGRTLYFDQPPAMIQGRLLVPLRGIFEALKSDVVYDAPTRSIQATKGDTVVQLQLGSRTALIDGRTTYLDVPADTVGGRTMVPLRFVSEALGADVKWNGATKTVMISSTSSPTTPNNNNNNNTSEAGAPKIERIVHTGTHVLSPGDALEVIVYGDPGARASFEILGQTAEQNLPEVSSGRYQTRYIIPAGLTVKKGVLLAHLVKNGRETAQESDREITVKANNNNNNNNNSNKWDTYPTANDNIGVARPQFTVNFPETVQQNTVRLYVDGVDFSRQTRMNGNQLLWAPQYDLPNGQHKVQARATATSGRTLDHQWNFNVDINSNANNGNFSIQELRPSNNQSTNSRPQIGAIFNQNIKPNNVTLVVDNLNVTNQTGSQKYSNGIMWTPTYDLSNGSHSATVTALDLNNRQVTRTWNFQVNGNNNNNNNNNNNTSGQNINVTNISNGITLPAVFNVQGSAQAGRQVTVLVEYTPNNLLQVLTGQTRQITKTALVDGNGHFDVPIDASAVSPNQNFRITVSDGGVSPTQVYTVRRQ